MNIPSLVESDIVKFIAVLGSILGLADVLLRMGAVAVDSYKIDPIKSISLIVLILGIVVVILALVVRFLMSIKEYFLDRDVFKESKRLELLNEGADIQQVLPGNDIIETLYGLQRIDARRWSEDSILKSSLLSFNYFESSTSYELSSTFYSPWKGHSITLRRGYQTIFEFDTTELSSENYSSEDYKNNLADEKLVPFFVTYKDWRDVLLKAYMKISDEFTKDLFIFIYTHKREVSINIRYMAGNFNKSIGFVYDGKELVEKGRE